MTESGEDKRSFARFLVSLPITYFSNHYGHYGQAKAKDMSPVGIGVATKEELSVGNQLEIWLEVPDGGDPFHAKGYVVWSGKLGVDQYQAGICLENIDLIGMSRVIRAIR